MRLFGVPGGSLNKARATYSFLRPFDLALASPQAVTFHAGGAGGFFMDVSATYYAQGPMPVGYFYYPYTVSPVLFNPLTDNSDIIGSAAEEIDVGANAAVGGVTVVCDC